MHGLLEQAVFGAANNEHTTSLVEFGYHEVGYVFVRISSVICLFVCLFVHVFII